MFSPSKIPCPLFLENYWACACTQVDLFQKFPKTTGSFLLKLHGIFLKESCLGHLACYTSLWYHRGS